MSDYRDFAAAQAALANPSTPAADLAQIAQAQPALRAAVAWHPSAYAELLDWLSAYGGPEAAAAVEARRGRDAAVGPSAAGAVSETPVDPNAFWSKPSADQPFVAPQPPQVVSQGWSPAQGWSQQPAAQYQPAAEPPTSPARKGRRPLVLAGVGVVVVALVAGGVVTNGFGLLPAAGGAATPEEEAVALVDKTIHLVDSFSARDLFNNPIKAMAELTAEVAPSEQALMSKLDGEQTQPNLVEWLGLSDATINWVGDGVAAFSVKADGLQASATSVSDDVSRVALTGGTITIDADLDALRTVLSQAVPTIDQQAKDFFAKYGLDSSLPSVGETLDADWVDESIAKLDQELPKTFDLADLAKLADECASAFDTCSSADPALDGADVALAKQLTMFVVREDGRWYYSSLLNVWEDYMPLISDNGEFDVSKLSPIEISPTKHDDPAEAAQALARAAVTGDVRKIGAELPMPERRVLEVFGSQMPASSSGSDYQVDTAQFSVAKQAGDQARLHIDSLQVSSQGLWSSGTTEIYDGTCVKDSYGTEGCLKDYVSEQGVKGWFATQDPTSYTWQSFQTETGVDAAKFLDTAQRAAVAAVTSLDLDQLGPVAVKDADGWHVSATATASDLQNQAYNAIAAGLRAVAVK
ncbi:MAG: hypothetical protein LBR32_11350 [Propionibacteriaceae bacterium]|jgi:hypothetical protein|nr:hypothetical protein [Propionibacteriaceae bacterium]